MNLTDVAALLFAAITSGVILFQLALAFGAPWGEYAMGGRYPGRFPPPMRVAAIVQAGLLALMAGVILSRAGITLPGWSTASVWLIWVVVAFCAVAAVLNLITPSARERRIWAPVTIVLLACSLIVALTVP